MIKMGNKYQKRVINNPFRICINDVFNMQTKI